MNDCSCVAIRMCSACRGDYEDPDPSAEDESLEPEDDAGDAQASKEISGRS